MNLFDNLEPEITIRSEVSYSCDNGHTSSNDDPPMRCEVCGHHWHYRWEGGVVTDIKKWHSDVFGDRCGCCGSRKFLRLVSKGFERVMLKRVFATPDQFGYLCKDCVKWRNDGPFCPCQIWEKQSPGWRQRRDGIL